MWWATMAAAWEMVAHWERSEVHGRFDAIVFSRPDIFYYRPMGPLCAYDDVHTTWYAPYGKHTPDMFWLFPRHIARHVLTTWRQATRPGLEPLASHRGERL